MTHDFSEQEMEQLERYYQSDMDAVELAAFEQKIQNDQDFAYKVGLYKDMVKSIELVGEEEIEANMLSVHQALKSEQFFKKSFESTPKIVNRRFAAQWKNVLAVAAGFLLILILGYYAFQKEEISLGTAFTQHYTPETEVLRGILDTLVVFGAADPNQFQKQALAEGLGFYETGNAAAIPALQSYLQQDQDSYIGQLYLGLAFLEEKQFQKAIEYLAPLANDQGFPYPNIAKWYLALAYTKVGTLDKARSLFQDLENEEKYGEQAAFYLEIL